MNSIPRPHPSWCDRQRCTQGESVIEHHEAATPWLTEDGATEVSIGRVRLDDDAVGPCEIRLGLRDVQSERPLEVRLVDGTIAADAHLSRADTQRIAAEMQRCTGMGSGRAVEKAGPPQLTALPNSTPRGRFLAAQDLRAALDRGTLDEHQMTALRALLAMLTMTVDIVEDVVADTGGPSHEFMAFNAMLPLNRWRVALDELVCSAAPCSWADGPSRVGIPGPRPAAELTSAR